MTYHMERFRFVSENDRQSSSMFVIDTDSGDTDGKHPKVLFPSKLWDALDVPRNDSNIIRWNVDGTAVIMDSNRLEKHVMRRYPGLVRIPTIANFRRQMNWYGFEWELDDTGEFRFTHPCFRRDSKDLLSSVLTRRRSFSATSVNLSLGRRNFRSTRTNVKRKYLTRKQRSQNDESSDDDDNSLDSEYGYSSGARNTAGDFTPKSTDSFAPFRRYGSRHHESSPSSGTMLHIDSDAPEWITYCAPHGLSDDGEIVRQTAPLNTRRVTIPVYFYDDTDMYDLVEDILEGHGEYCLQGVPTAQPVALNDKPQIQHREITSIYEM